MCVSPIVSGMIGIDETCLTATSQVKREDMALEVVLVLDSSGSMESWSPSAGMKRVEAMEAAAKAFIDKLQALDDPDLANDVRIGLGPYAGSVKLNPSYRGQGWLDGEGASSANQNLFYSVATMAAVGAPRRFDLYDAMGCVARLRREPPRRLRRQRHRADAAQPDSLSALFRADEPDVSGTAQTIAYPNSLPGRTASGQLLVNGVYRPLTEPARFWVL